MTDRPTDTHQADVPLTIRNRNDRRTQLRAQVEQAHTYAAPTEMSKPRFAAISDATKRLSLMLIDLCPDGRDLSICLTLLEDVRMRANKSIATNPGNLPVPEYFSLLEYGGR